MKVTLLTMGKTDVRWVREGLEMYVSRLSHYIPFTLNELAELRNTASLSREQIREKEGDLLLSAVKPSEEVILLDERGAERTSAEFAAFLQDRLSRGGRDLTFVIGGAYGFSRRVYDRADGMLALSRMTFPHQLVRTVFAEQLYRAFTILRGEPYHHA